MRSTSRPNRDEVERAVKTITQMFRFAQRNVRRFGSIEGVTSAEITLAAEDFALAMDIVEVLNDALPSNARG